MYNKILLKSLAIAAALTVFSCTAEQEFEDTFDSPEESAELQTKAIQGQDYYWRHGKKVFLDKAPGKQYLVFDTADEKTVLNAIGGRVIRQGETRLETTRQKRVAGAAVAALDKWAIVESARIKSDARQIKYKGDFYTTEEGRSVGLSHLAYVKLKSNEDIMLLEKFAAKLNFVIEENNEFMPLWYTINCVNSNLENSMAVANFLSETGLFAEAEPDLMPDSLIDSVPNDPMFSYQWNLYNTGQWGGQAYAGNDIKYRNSNDVSLGSASTIVAVIDQGVQMNHPDLNIYSVSYDTMNGSSPSQVRGDHATSCAGIIAAKTHNNLGVASIAPYCPIMSISHSLYNIPSIASQLADGFNFAWRNGAAVISNSWGGLSQSSILEDAINNALTNGRNGKGCVVVFSSGNNNGAVLYPANSIDDIIVVGAMSPDGKRKSPSTIDNENWWGSNYGATLDVVAPGVKIYTTDRTGSNGYASGDYTPDFNGTSSACPHVAATAALIIAEKPDITQKKVAEAISRSAVKLSSYSFSSQKTYGSWNNEVGYGLIDPKKAIQQAIGSKNITYNGAVSNTWKSLIGSNITVQNATVNSNSKLSLTASSACQINSINVAAGASFVIQN